MPKSETNFTPEHDIFTLKIEDDYFDEQVSTSLYEKLKSIVNVKAVFTPAVKKDVTVLLQQYGYSRIKFHLRGQIARVTGVREETPLEARIRRKKVELEEQKKKEMGGSGQG